MARQLSGVRIRTTLAATVVVAVVLGVAAVGFVVLQQHELRNSLAAVARQRTSDVAAQLAASGVRGGKVPAPHGSDDSLVQVITQDGKLLAASKAIETDSPITSLRPRAGRVQMRYVHQLPVEGRDGFVVVARGVRTNIGTVVVIAAQSLEGVNRSSDVVTDLLQVGYPLIVLLVGLVAYWLTGRSLAPVRSMSARVASIGGADLHERVPVPPAGDDISRLAETMNAMLQRLQAASETQRRFVADASHELRSPLATIRAANEIGNAHPDAADWKEISGDVLAETGRLDRLVADLLLLARIDEGGPPLTAEDVDIDDLVGMEADRLRKVGERTVDLNLRPVRVVGDRSQLERLVRNLADNAMWHAQTRVRLAVRSEGHHAIIEVSDDGPGVPHEARARVFERFVRLDESRARDSGGSGLGLAIAKEIAAAHAGEIQVDDADPGARFIVTLPLKPT